MRKILCRLIIIMCALLFGVAHACDTNQIDVLGDGTNCIDTKFSLTTTSLTLPDESEFRWYMSASGTFYVDCGTDGTLSGTGVVGKTITRTNTDEAQYTCTYTSGGEKNIKFSGLANRYRIGTLSAIRFSYHNNSTDEATTQRLIASINGSLGAIFPTLGQSDSLTPCFRNTFRNATRIQNIPENLFTGVTGSRERMFYQTFLHANITSIPENLFSGISGAAQEMFRSTFWGTKITQIPENLFAGVYGGANGMFYSVFRECDYLTSIPENLFAGVSESAKIEFAYAFYNCDSLTGYIPPSVFAGLIKNGSPYDDSNEEMMGDVFADSRNLATTCLAGTTQFITGYEDYWSGKVSCVPEQFTCDAGTYLPAHWYQCEDCPANDYCVGGTYNYSEQNNSGITACPNKYSLSAVGASAQTDCYKTCTTNESPHVTSFTGGNYYGGVNTCAPADSNSCDNGYHYVSANGNNLPYCGANEITINWDDGNGGADTTTCTYGGTITTPTVAPTKRGHTFLGWRFVAPSGN